MQPPQYFWLFYRLKQLNVILFFPALGENCFTHHKNLHWALKNRCFCLSLMYINIQTRPVAASVWLYSLKTEPKLFQHCKIDAPTHPFGLSARVQSPLCIENQWWGPLFLHAGDSWPLQANTVSKPESMNCLFCRRPLAIFNLWNKIEARTERIWAIGRRGSYPASVLRQAADLARRSGPFIFQGVR